MADLGGIYRHSKKLQTDYRQAYRSSTFYPTTAPWFSFILIETALTKKSASGSIGNFTGHLTEKGVPHRSPTARGGLAEEKGLHAFSRKI